MAHKEEKRSKAVTHTHQKQPKTKPKPIQRSVPLRTNQPNLLDQISFTAVPTLTPATQPVQRQTAPQVKAVLPNHTHWVQRDGQDRRGQNRTNFEYYQDRTIRRPEGGRDTWFELTEHFKNDWAGRAILARYLTGAGDWTIDNDPKWSAYMKRNQELSRQVRNRLQYNLWKKVDEVVANPEDKSLHTGKFYHQKHLEISGGEGMTGYQYLHGTNSDVGDFEIEGPYTIVPFGDNTVLVDIQFECTFNDITDPNPTYSTDTWKSSFAELITLGYADGFDLHISWKSQATLLFDLDTRTVQGQAGLIPKRLKTYEIFAYHRSHHPACYRP